MQASYFLTGEHRGYKRSSKAFDRVRPIENAFLVRTGDGICRGKGAWEMKIRWSYLDLLSTGGATAGYQDDFTAGLNWYLNPYTRLMFDYVSEDINRNSIAGKGNANMFGMRFQVDF